MKKAFFCVLALILCLVLTVGCGGTDTSSDDTSSVTVSKAPSNTSSGTVSTPNASTDTSSDTASKLTEEQIKMTQYLGSFSDKIDTLNENTKGKFTFGLQSDTHHYDTAKTAGGNNIVALSYFVEMDFVGHLGDIVRGYSVEDIDSPENMRACMDDMVNRFVNNAKVPVMMTVGNHDTNSMWCNKWGDHTTQITPEEQKTRIFDRLKEHNGDKMVTDDDGSYYYIDFPEDGIRVIMLNTSNDTYDGTRMCSTAFVSEKQIEWFKTEALNTQNQVIVMSHIPFTTAVEENKLPAGGAEIAAAVEEFISGGGEFIAYCCGHKHGKSSAVDENGRLHIVISNGSSKGSVVSVNTKDSTVFVYDLGGGTDLVFDYADGRMQ